MPVGRKRAPGLKNMQIYIASSFKHKHGVRLLGKELIRLGCSILDWTAWATPPPGLTPQERRAWMDTDLAGGQVYNFCHNACLNADLVIYYGASGQDAGVEVGMASACGAPVLGIEGPLEAPGLMLNGAVDVWVNSPEDALTTVQHLLLLRKDIVPECSTEQLKNARKLLGRLLDRTPQKDSNEKNQSLPSSCHHKE